MREAVLQFNRTRDPFFGRFCRLFSLREPIISPCRDESTDKDSEQTDDRRYNAGPHFSHFDHCVRASYTTGDRCVKCESVAFETVEPDAAPRGVTLLPDAGRRSSAARPFRKTSFRRDDRTLHLA